VVEEEAIGIKVFLLPDKTHFAQRQREELSWGRDDDGTATATRSGGAMTGRQWRQEASRAPPPPPPPPPPTPTTLLSYHRIAAAGPRRHDPTLALLPPRPLQLPPDHGSWPPTTTDPAPSSNRSPRRGRRLPRSSELKRSLLY
jgi:hypothetical protein